MKLTTFLHRIESDAEYRQHMRTGPWTATEACLLWEAAPQDPELREFAQAAAHVILCKKCYEVRGMLLMRLAGDETLSDLQRHKLENILRALDDAFAGEIVGAEKIR